MFTIVLKDCFYKQNNSTNNKLHTQLIPSAYLECIRRPILLLLHGFFQHVCAVRRRESPSSCTPCWSTTTDQVTHYGVTSFSQPHPLVIYYNNNMERNGVFKIYSSVVWLAKRGVFSSLSRSLSLYKSPILTIKSNAVRIRKVPDIQPNIVLLNGLIQLRYYAKKKCKILSRR